MEVARSYQSPEIEADLIAARHMASCPLSRGLRVLAIVDNTSTLNAISKGRSSSQALNEVCRKIFLRPFTSMDHSNSPLVSVSAKSS